MIYLKALIIRIWTAVITSSCFLFFEKFQIAETRYCHAEKQRQHLVPIFFFFQIEMVAEQLLYATEQLVDQRLAGYSEITPTYSSKTNRPREHPFCLYSHFKQCFCYLPVFSIKDRDGVFACILRYERKKKLSSRNAEVLQDTYKHALKTRAHKCHFYRFSGFFPAPA